MKKALLLVLFVTTFLSAQNAEKEKINKTLDAWHKAAAEVKFDDYFNAMTEDAIFIGTDATENWVKPDFQTWAKPFFKSGKTWNFTALERHIFFDKTGQVAWFDELLNTQMKICRGSGVLVKVGKQWKIQQYVLSMTVPNDEVSAAIKIKAPIEDALIAKLEKK